MLNFCILLDIQNRHPINILRFKQRRVHDQNRSRRNVLTFNSAFDYHPETDYLDISAIQIGAMNKICTQEKVRKLFET